ncbi:hypothetical protein ACFPT7_23740 [Acidicapsa dinghuensis]|uniref:WXG100 family type VII secretion target n=1 Tax=Acidicapsa dinghuensis TaxID=2218256 RepID=A0ABW1ENG5_9BACT|nr:hypothetical protein [Acidicapsa dinghuensis]
MSTTDHCMELTQMGDAHRALVRSLVESLEESWGGLLREVSAPFHNMSKTAALTGEKLELTLQVAPYQVRSLEELLGGTGGLSLLADAGVGAGANAIGGEVTRLIEGKDTSTSDVVEDAVAGYAGGTVGHVAADLVHIPEVGPEPKAYNNKAAIRRMANYKKQIAN